jgi:acyl-CoA thioester hydrolase
MTYVHSIRIRYGECDMQKVVFNANYWVYCDDAIDQWIRKALALEMGVEAGLVEITEIDFDFMLKTASGTWHSAVVFGDTADLHCSVSRWGNTSFDVKIDMRVGGESRFEAVITYVSVGVKSRASSPVPDVVRRALTRVIS